MEGAGKMNCIAGAFPPLGWEAGEHSTPMRHGSFMKCRQFGDSAVAKMTQILKQEPGSMGKAGDLVKVKRIAPQNVKATT